MSCDHERVIGVGDCVGTRLNLVSLSPDTGSVGGSLERLDKPPRLIERALDMTCGPFLA
jgi:hypothetical protein